MEGSVQQKFNQAILKSALKKFSLDFYPYQALDGFENFLYQVETPQKQLILRLSHNSKKDQRDIGSELAYLHYLAGNRVDVAMPQLSADGNLIETIPDGQDGYFSVICLEKAPGTHPQGAVFNEALYYNWGKAMGRMHQLSAAYQPEVEKQRIHWYEEVEVTQPEKYLPSDQWLILEKWQETISRLRTLPVTGETYGVIHNDLHPHNFLVDGNKITMIDFEDAVQMWFVSDIAISLFMTSVVPPHGLSRENFVLSFLPEFIRGYQTEKELDPVSLYRMPLFLKFREIGQYIALYRAMDPDDPNPWIQQFMDGRRERIEHDVPVFALNHWDRYIG